MLSRLGRVIGATELKVSTDRVTIEELAVELVTGISMSLSLEKEIPSMLVARIDRHTKLRHRYQVGVVRLESVRLVNVCVVGLAVPQGNYCLLYWYMANLLDSQL